MKDTVNFIQELYQTKEFIPLHEPKFFGNEKNYLNEAIDSTFVSSVGRFVDKFELEFAKKVGSKFAIATVNGTSALHLALLLGGVIRDDEVITQALSFVATANAISYIGAKPIFIDVDVDTMGMSPKALEIFLTQNCKLVNGLCINTSTSKIIRAVVPMHTFGHPCKIDEIQRLCKTYNIVLIEDAAESLGSFYKQKHTGTFGRLGIFSFNGNKIITSGGGGVIVTDDASLAKRAKHLSTTAKTDNPYEYIHDSVAFNYRMPNLNAALLVAQLEQLDKFLESKRLLAQEYEHFFKHKNKITFIKEPKNAKSNYWLQAVLLQDKSSRDTFLEYTNKNAIMTRAIWKLISELEMYKGYQNDGLINSHYLQDRVINITSSVL